MGNMETTMSMRQATKDRLKALKITPGEYWDDVLNRLADCYVKQKAEA